LGPSPANVDNVNFAELIFFGTPGPTTLDKGSLTLGRSLDVPRVSRYDVDTETPRPEKLVVDFDTTVNSSPTDISGEGNHGAFKGTNMNYSSADKAFVFNGTNDYIESSVETTADLAHSVSVWIKVDTVGNNTFFSLGDPTATTATLTRKSSTMYTTSSGFAFVFFGGDMTIPFSYSTNRWYHIVGTRDTGGTYPNTQKFYIDGVDYTGSASFDNTTSTTLDFPSTSTLYIGRVLWASSDFDGQISNFKLYNVALEPSEVKKLYNLGRTGRSMVISDTAVGIGKVPEAQLDVRGSGGFTGDLTVGGNMNNYQYWFRGNRNGQNTNGATSGSLLVIQYDGIAGSYTSAWTGSNKYTCPEAGVYMTHGNFMAFPNTADSGYNWVEVRRYSNTGAQLDGGSANDMHTPYRDNVYQSWHFQQTHLCNKGDRLQIMYRASSANAHLDLHGNWGNVNIYKIG
jgi:hypothetical protein